MACILFSKRACSLSPNTHLLSSKIQKLKMFFAAIHIFVSYHFLGVFEFSFLCVEEVCKREVKTAIDDIAFHNSWCETLDIRGLIFYVASSCDKYLFNGGFGNILTERDMSFLLFHLHLNHFLGSHYHSPCLAHLTLNIPNFLYRKVLLGRAGRGKREFSSMHFFFTDHKRRIELCDFNDIAAPAWVWFAKKSVSVLFFEALLWNGWCFKEEVYEGAPVHHDPVIFIYPNIAALDQPQ